MLHYEATLVYPQRHGTAPCHVYTTWTLFSSAKEQKNLLELYRSFRDKYVKFFLRSQNVFFGFTELSAVRRHDAAEKST